MKVLLVSCLIFGIAQATLPGLSRGGSNVGASANILGDLVGGAQGVVRFLRGNVNRLSGSGNSEASTAGELVDGTGAGVQSVGQVSSGDGYSYSAPPKPVYGPPQQSVSAVAPVQSSYLPPQPRPQAQPKPQYGPPQVQPKPQYIAPQVQPKPQYIEPVQPKPQYGPPQVQPKPQYIPPQAQPKPQYGPPSSQEPKDCSSSGVFFF